MSNDKNYNFLTDNEISNIYRYAAIKGIPIKWIKKDEKNNLIYIPDLIQVEIDRGKNLKKINDEIVEKYFLKEKKVHNRKINKDIIFLYYQIRSGSEDFVLEPVLEYYRNTLDLDYNNEDFLQDYKNWEIKIGQELNSIYKITQKIIKDSEDLLNLEKNFKDLVEITNSTETLAFLEINPKLNNTDVKILDGYFIFDNIILTDRIVAVNYQTDKKNFYKTLNFINQKPFQDEIIKLESKINTLEESLTFISFSGNKNQQVVDSKNFRLITYDLNRNILRVKKSIDLDFLKESLPFLELKVKKKIYTQKVTIRNFQFKPILLLQFLQVPPFKYFFHVDDTNRKLFKSNNYKIVFQPHTTLDTSIFKQEYKALSLSTNFIAKDGNNPTVTLKTSQYTRREVYNSFKRAIIILFSAYQETEEKFISELIQDYPDTKKLLRLDLKTETTDKKEKQIKFLQSFDTEKKYFFDGYSRKINKYYYPDIITDQEAEVWKSKKIKYNNKFIYKSVMRFPQPESLWNIVCPDFEKKGLHFPGVKINKETKRWIPKCFKEPQTKKENYLKFMGTFQEPENKIKSKNVKGYLPSGISSIFARNLNIRMLRTNIPDNDIIQGILFSLGVPEYLKLQGTPAVKKYLEKLKNDIIDSVGISCLKQQNYEKSDEDIKSNFFNTVIYPDEYFHLLEIYFKINIFTFSVLEDEKGQIEVPKYKFFHHHNKPIYSTTVLFYINKKDIDLIYSPGGLYYHDKKVGEFCYKILLKRIKTISLSREGDSINLRKGFFNLVNFSQILPNINSQRLDIVGKAVSFNFKYKNKDVTVFIPPCQPQNYPESKSISYCSSNLAQELFGPATSRTSEGLWFPYSDKSEEIFVFTTEQPKNLILSSKISPGKKFGKSKLVRMIKLKRVLYFFKEILRWLYYLSGEEDVEDFLQPLAEIDQNVVNDSLGYYDFSGIESVFPSDITTLNSAFEFLKDKTYNLITTDERGYRLWFYSQKFYDLLLSDLKFYRRYMDRNKYSFHIKEFYRDSSDFKQKPNVKIFTSNLDYLYWLNNFDYPRLVKSLDTTLEFEINPYIYKYTLNNYVLIQNVLDGELNRALKVAENWKVNRINLGFSEKNNVIKIKESYYLYINKDSKLIKVKQVGINTPTLHILAYSYSVTSKGIKTSRYAAILPI